MERRSSAVTSGSCRPLASSDGTSAMPSRRGARRVVHRPAVVGAVLRRAHRGGGAVQRAAAVHAGADHVPADRRAAERARARRAARRRQSVLYLAAGIAGLPVFAASATLPPGALRLLGPTGGYLMAYPLAAFVVGACARARVRSPVGRRRCCAMVARPGRHLRRAARCGSATSRVRRAPPVGLASAFATGVAPFAVADVLKIAVAAGVVPGLWRLVGPPARAGRRGPSAVGPDSPLTDAPVTRRADHRGQRLGRRRRHPGRPQDLRRARRVRRVRHHRHHRAEHARRSRPCEVAVGRRSSARRSRRVVADFARARGEDRHARQRRDRRGRGARGPRRRRMPHLVVDPVMVAKSGDRLLDDRRASRRMTTRPAAAGRPW